MMASWASCAARVTAGIGLGGIDDLTAEIPGLRSALTQSKLQAIMREAGKDPNDLARLGTTDTSQRALALTRVSKATKDLRDHIGASSRHCRPDRPGGHASMGHLVTGRHEAHLMCPPDPQRAHHRQMQRLHLTPALRFFLGGPCGPEPRIMTRDFSPVDRYGCALLTWWYISGALSPVCFTWFFRQLPKQPLFVPTLGRPCVWPSMRDHVY